MKYKMLQKVFIPIFIVYSMGVFAATYHSFNRPTDHKHIVTVNGKIEKDEYSKFKRFIDSQTLPIDIILLQSNGGYISPALEIGEYIHEHSLHTRVETYCNSACLYPFLSGKHPVLYQKGEIAIHRPYRGEIGKDMKHCHRHEKLYNKLIRKLTQFTENKKLASRLVEKMYQTPVPHRYSINKENSGEWHIHVSDKGLLNHI